MKTSDSPIPRREAMVAEAADPARVWDVVVIGGGATGLGAALDAALRGYRTLVLEGRDFTSSTSSRSTKLIHGGVRYLRQGDFPLLRESLRERGLLLRNAPDLVQRMAFVVPAHGAWEKLYYGTGLKLYDRLAGRWGLGASRLLSRGETLESLPNIKEKGLRGGVRYFDAQFNDSRLALSLMLACLAQGGTPLNYFPVRSLIKEGNRVRGVVAEDGETGIAYPIRARVVINATGIHTDLIRKLDRPECADMMTASQGAHLVLPREFLPGDHAIMIPKTDDGRVLFAIPWLGRVLVGTTDTPVPGPADEPAPMDEEVQYLLEHCGRIFERAPRREDLLSIYAGIRPLARGKPGAKTSRISRNHVVEVSPNGLVTITGGKWTTYRQMAEDAVDAAAEVGGLERKGCRTKDLRLRDETAGAGIDVLVAENAGWSELLHPALPYRKAEVVRAARWEMARTLEDVLSRRLRALVLNAQAAGECAEHAASLLGHELGHDAEWMRRQVAEFRELAARHLPSGATDRPIAGTNSYGDGKASVAETG